MKSEKTQDLRATDQPERYRDAFVRQIKNFVAYIKHFEINAAFLAIGIVLMLFAQETGNHEISSVFKGLITAAGVLILLAGTSLRIAYEWERVPVLRFGKFHRTCGPGIFWVIPLVDIVQEYLDCRIRVTDFSAEKVLTKDAVPVYVDAIIFWMIWDAGKAKLEVSDFKQAVPLSGKTALREIIGRSNLSKILSEREIIGHELRDVLDEKTSPWGITALSVEIKDIVIPPELDDVISKEAQAEREKKARIIIGEAEIEIARQYAQASKEYENNETAMTLRSLNLLLETVKKEGSMILVPSNVPNLMNQALAAGISKNQSTRYKRDQS